LAIIVFYVRDAGIPYLTARAQMGDFVPANLSSGYITFDDYYRTANT
jgi:phage-related holin